MVDGLLVCTDGLAAYPRSIVRAFRDKVKQQARRGRYRLEAWPNLCIATVIKHTKHKRVVEITRTLTRRTEKQAHELLTSTKGCLQFNTAFIERLNGTFRERLASLSRKCRPSVARIDTLEEGMYLIGCTHNFCFPHQELSKKTQLGCPTTPAMAAALTDHIWSMRELLWYKVAPAPWVQAALAQPKRSRGRPGNLVEGEQPHPKPKRPRGRPPKYVLAEVLAATRTSGLFTT